MEVLTWLGIAFCVSQSAMFSGLNLALFGITRLRLEVDSQLGNSAATRVLELRRDSNFLLTTILWGNVAINTLLALLANSIMTGVVAFVFSTVLITFVGEIGPQAYFSRNAVRMASLLAPILRIYQFILYPIAKPCALALDLWLGREGIQYFRERGLRALLQRHIEAAETDIDRLEGVGALNFLALDDLVIAHEGQPVDPESVVTLPVGESGKLTIPKIGSTLDDPFLRTIQKSGKKWVILVDPEGAPRLVVDADGLLRNALFDHATFRPRRYCHRPVVVTDSSTPLGEVIVRLRVVAETPEDDVIDRDLILLWGEQRRVITGADLLGRLLRGVVTTEARWACGSATERPRARVG